MTNAASRPFTSDPFDFYVRLGTDDRYAERMREALDEFRCLGHRVDPNLGPTLRRLAVTLRDRHAGTYDGDPVEFDMRRFAAEPWTAETVPPPAEVLAGLMR